ncbi:MAG: nucleotidyl transferase AbiEii/AbiGii toxin family protein [Eubacterium sp.]|nr:nucleotidyl transferase AbiEii/AbiGii toxin family protein [Eubacterium sp.]
MISAKSVKDRLKNKALTGGKSMQEILIAYGLERTVYRLSTSEYKKSFTLKGGIFMYALFGGKYPRATRDLDLLARNVHNSEENIKKIFEIIFSVECDDALKYDLATLEVRTITEFKKYHGVNVSIVTYLDRTRIPISIDIGFDDVVYPDRVKMEFPVLLDTEAPEIYVYSITSVISEKFEAIVLLGNANSRYKDFYDIYILANSYDIDGEELKESVDETFRHRETSFDDIFAFTDDFVTSEIHQRRWKAFMDKKKVMVCAELKDVVNLLRKLLFPVVDSIRSGMQYTAKWDHESRSWI